MIIIVSLIFLMLSCQTKKEPSVLVIAFEQLSPEQINCLDDTNTELSGTAHFCKEAIRYTHVYTTSLQPAAAIGSILTGHYPFFHQIKNSVSVLNSTLKTIPEIAQKQNVRTAFFGGNPHVLRKTGLATGFDVFDDSAAAEYSASIITDFKKTTSDFLKWSQEKPDERFFSLLTNSESIHLYDYDTNQSNFEKLNEKLNTFIWQLKKNKLWENNYIILLGLRGHNNFQRINKSTFSNLHSENTQVSLFIKPPRQKGDEGISWKNDQYLSLADLGFSLALYFKGKIEPINNSFTSTAIQAFNLQTLTQTGAASSSKAILVESTIPFISSLRANSISVITNQVNTLISENHIEAYNLLSDLFEQTDISNSKNYLSNISEAINQSQLLNPMHTNKDANKKDQSERANNLIINFYKQVSLAQQFIKAELKKAPFFNEQNIKKISLSHENPLFMPYVIWLNKKNLLKSNLPIEALNEPFKNCLDLLPKKIRALSQLEQCQNELFLTYLKYKNAKNLNLSEENQKLIYEIKRKNFIEDNKISIWNLALENIWGLFSQQKNWYSPLIIYDESWSY